MEGGALLSKWKCANTFRSGNGFNNNSSWNSSSCPSSFADPIAIEDKSSRKSKRTHLRGSAIDWVRERLSDCARCAIRRTKWRRENGNPPLESRDDLLI